MPRVALLEGGSHYASYCFYQRAYAIADGRGDLSWLWEHGFLPASNFPSQEIDLFYAGEEEEAGGLCAEEFRAAL